MTIGENIRYYRKEKGLTQKELGNMCGINEVQIRRYELGGSNPKLETIQKIAKALNVEPYALDDRLINIRIGYQTLQYLESELDRIYNYSGDISAKEKYRKEIERSILQFQNELMELELNEPKLLNNYRLLNEEGKKEANKRIEELTEITRYTKK